MLRKFSLSLLCAGALFSAASMAMNHELSSGLSIEYDFLPNKPELLSNYTIFTINAVCNIQTAADQAVIHVRAVSKSGSINGQKIQKGEELDVTVRNNDQLQLSAQSAAQVELTNTSDLPVKALCKTA